MLFPVHSFANALAKPYDACNLFEPCPERSPEIHGHKRNIVPRPGSRKSRKRDQTRPAKRTPPGIFLSTTTEHRLFLGALGLRLVADTLLPGTLQAGVGPRLAEGLVGTTLDVLGELALGDLGEGSGNRLGDAEGGADALCGLGGLLVLGGIGLGDLVGLAGEDNQASLVLLKALDVDGEALLGEVLAAGIDGDTDGRSIKLGDTSSLSARVLEDCLLS